MRSHRPTLLLLPLLAVAACAPEPDSVRIGVVLAESGLAAGLMAVADANADPRAARAHLRLDAVSFEQSSPVDPLTAIATADSLGRDPRVVGVVGHSNSAASIAAAQIYNAHRLTQLAPTTTAPLYGDAGPYSFRMVPDDTEQGRFLASVLTADEANRRVAVVYVNDDYGRALWKALEAALDGSGAAVVSQTPILEAWDSTAMTLAARSVAEAHPDVVVWLARAPDLQSFRGTFVPLAPGVEFLASDGIDSATLFGPDNRPFRGVTFVRFLDPAQQGPALQAFRARYRATFHREATADAVLAYDATRLLADAVLSGARTREEVHSHLRSLTGGTRTHPGLAGPVWFGARREGHRPYLLARVGGDGVVRPVPSPGTP
jgi:branched-chain amino acid transport system substrate-binding protein